MRKGQVNLGRLLVVKAKGEVDYNNLKWYRSIIFNESSLKELAELFPEQQIKTDYNAFKLIEELEMRL
ncbi:MAG: hypothetical protein AOA65_1870 [Candidatus Bathyarchaeota archaeon BA1]|nr:MAG: hypothetical protein AOA65_1870 [Candidatus Bathyarchaeota archaeon BA1]